MNIIHFKYFRFFVFLLLFIKVQCEKSVRKWRKIFKVLITDKNARRDTPYLSVCSPNAGNADQNNSEYGHFLHSEKKKKNKSFWLGFTCSLGEENFYEFYIWSYYQGLPEVVCKVGALERFTKFIRKHQRKSHLFNKVTVWGL